MNILRKLSNSKYIRTTIILQRDHFDPRSLISFSWQDCDTLERTSTVMSSDNSERCFYSSSFTLWREWWGEYSALPFSFPSLPYPWLALIVKRNSKFQNDLMWTFRWTSLVFSLLSSISRLSRTYGRSSIQYVPFHIIFFSRPCHKVTIVQVVQCLCVLHCSVYHSFSICLLSHVILPLLCHQSSIPFTQSSVI